MKSYNIIQCDRTYYACASAGRRRAAADLAGRRGPRASNDHSSNTTCLTRVFFKRGE